jgi:hypothetical protein
MPFTSRRKLVLNELGAAMKIWDGSRGCRPSFVWIEMSSESTRSNIELTNSTPHDVKPLREF